MLVQHHNLISINDINNYANSVCGKFNARAYLTKHDEGCNICLDINLNRYDKFYFECHANSNVKPEPNPNPPDVLKKQDNLEGDHRNIAVTKCHELGFVQPSQKFSECLKRFTQ